METRHQDHNDDSAGPFQRWLNACAAILPGGSRELKGKNKVEEEVWPHPETERERSVREKVERMAVDLAKTSPMIRFMSRHLSMISCNPYTDSGPSFHDPDERPSARSPLGRITFSACAPTRAGGFEPDPDHPPHSAILICANRIRSKAHLEQTLAHEMIHWYDHCRFHVDWNNVRHNACTEIRAAALSGDCAFRTEFERGYFLAHPSFLKQHQACARRRAVVSLASSHCLAHLGKDNEGVRMAAAEKAVDEVWQACFNDTRPFDEIY
ncbi:hypothetical protein V8E36_008584 [Tilletia maclaganii]